MMNFIDDKNTNITILDVNVTNMEVIASKENFGDIDADDTAYHGYYINIL